MKHNTLKEKRDILLKGLLKEVSNKIDSKEELAKHGIAELRGDLTLEIIKEKFPWLLKAKIEQAVLGIDSQGEKKLIWYNGIWKSGVWEDGKWFNGTWKSGDWQDGSFSNGEFLDGVWHKGKWFGGNIKKGFVITMEVKSTLKIG